MFKIGDKVFINLESEYRDQGHNGKKRMIGDVIKFDSTSHPIGVIWENGDANHYREKDLEFENQEPQYEIY